MKQVGQWMATVIDAPDDDTLVCNLAEFGRTPRVNPAGGRDHWPQCWTMYFAGGGGIAVEEISPRGIGAGPQHSGARLPVPGDNRRDGKSVFGKIDRRAQERREIERAETRVRAAPRVDRSGDGNRQNAGRRRLAPACLS